MEYQTKIPETFELPLILSMPPSIQWEPLSCWGVRYLNIIEDPRIHKLLRQPAYVEANSCIEVAPAPKEIP
jgi:hypothetical protein